MMAEFHGPDTDRERMRNLCGQAGQFRYEKCWGQSHKWECVQQSKNQRYVFKADTERGQKKLPVLRLDKPQDRTIVIVTITTSWEVLLPSKTMKLRPLNLVCVKIKYSF